MPEEGRALLARGGFPPADVETMLERAACHPFLVQLIASRLFESRDLAVTLDQLAADEMVANYFAVDFNTLEQVERDALSEVAREGSGTRSGLARTLGRPEEDLDAPLYGLLDARLPGARRRGLPPRQLVLRALAPPPGDGAR